MSDHETTPVEDADRTTTDADRPVPELADALQEENAATSLDQPSDSSS